MSSSNIKCVAESSLGIATSITFTVIYGLILTIVSIYSFHSLYKYNSKFISSSRVKKLKLWLQDVYKRRRCYLPIITHLADMITDIGVIIQFGELAVQTTEGECGIKNMWYLFALSLFILIFYRTISAFLLYQSTQSLKRALIQWLDFELFTTLYINYLCDKKEPSSPQRWITSLEAVFESAPQALIQTIFLVKTETFQHNPIIVASLVFSLWSIVSKIISDDRGIAIITAKHANFVCASRKFKSCSCISWQFMARYIWRILDVSSRILIASLLWVVLGG
eukprot:526608_1